MAADRYKYETTISFGGDIPTAEFEVEFSFSVSWGHPAVGPSYSHGGLPADPDEIDDIEVVSVDGKRSGWSEYQSDADFAETLINRLGHNDFDAMLETAAEERAAALEEAMERRREDRRWWGS